MRLCTSLLLLAGLLAAQTDPAVAFEVTVTVDVGKPIGSLPPIWRFFGADEPNYATQPDGEKLLLELGNLRPGQVYFRAHNLMTTGDGTPDFKWGSTPTSTPKRMASLSTISPLSIRSSIPIERAGYTRISRLRPQVRCELAQSCCGFRSIRRASDHWSARISAASKGRY